MIRLLDVVLSVIAILIFSPILLPIIFLLKVTGEGEVFYRQERIGKNQKPFQLLKFATMLKNSPSMAGGTITIADDPRILPLGRILRKTKINELPQLLNVLIGDMSLIGPRPMVKNNFDYYDEKDKEIIASVRPGLSGIGSIIFRDEETILGNIANREEFYRLSIAPYKAELEKWFVSNYSMRVYFILIIATIFVVIKPNTKFVFRIFSTIPPIPLVLKDKD
jgi:lipopolysaccharide/colanic/teichoic acid biosynthesis glycosyltransferase